MAGTTRLELEALWRRERVLSAAKQEREPPAEILSAAKDLIEQLADGKSMAGTTRLELATSAVTGAQSGFGPAAPLAGSTF